ncbi:MAG: hypothetical protein ACM3OB_08095 [Acidobacteriota bacterium]
MKRVFVLLALSFLAGPFGAGAAADQSACDLTGTWYGGPNGVNWMYTMVITPVALNRYSVTFFQSIDPKPFGYDSCNPYTGEIYRHHGKFTVRVMSSCALPRAPGEDPTQSSPQFEVDALESSLRFSGGCDTLVHTLYHFGGYAPFSLDKVPFVTPYDVDFLGGETGHETYHRLHTDPR